MAKYPGTVKEDPGADIYNSYAYGSDGKEGSICLVMFTVRQFGKYRITVEAVQDQPVFDGVNAYLTVEKRFNPGE
jgi:hypothetical protein